MDTRTGNAQYSAPALAAPVATSAPAMISNFFFMLSSSSAWPSQCMVLEECWRASDPTRLVYYRRSRIRRSLRPLWGVVRKCLLRPARIAGIAPVVARIAISAAAVDEQCALDPTCRQIALEGAHIVSEVFALEA